MRIEVSLPILLGLGAAAAMLIGCDSTPASQDSESVSPPQVEEAATAVDSVPTPQAQGAAAIVDSVPQTQDLEVGYEVGLRAPEFGMSLLDGSRVTSSSLADEGKPVFLYFHATF